MADSQLCTCCTAQASMRCSACYAVGIVVPFCSAEHQKLIWSTHKAICGRVLTEPFIAPLTKAELLSCTVLIDIPDSNPTSTGLVRWIEDRVPLEQRPLRVPGNSVRTVADLPKTYADAFQNDWDWFQAQPTILVDPPRGRLHQPTSFRVSLLRVIIDENALQPNFIHGPPLHPSVVPYMFLAFQLEHLYRQESVMQGTNAVAYVNSLVIYTTVICRYIMDPADSPLNHLPQLEELGRRVELEASRVKERGTMVRVKDDPSMRPRQTETMSPVDWSFREFVEFSEAMQRQDRVFPRLR